jgi:pimeloyl-ACP methyl ester carboxylesterase
VSSVKKPATGLSTRSVNSAATRFEFKCGDTKLSALDFGNADAPDMILLHGIRDLAWSMSSIAHEFAGDFHVVVPDLRGHGDSDNPGMYSMTHFIADLHALVTYRELKDPVIIAHSLGGHIAAQYSALYPESVRALVLIDGMGPPRMEAPPSQQQMMMRERIQNLVEGGSRSRPMKDMGEARQRLMRNNIRMEPDMAHLLATEGTRSLADGELGWKWDSRADQVWGTFSSDENESRLGWIKCPVLLITAEHSMQYWEQLRAGFEGMQDHHDAEVERRRKLFVDARHQTINGAGHMIHYDQPQQLNQVLRQFVSTR